MSSDNSSLEFPVSARPKFDWYETDKMVVLSILVKNMVTDHVSVQFMPRALTFKYCPEAGDPLLLSISLCSTIIPSESSYRVSPVKAEIKMRKVNNFHWGKLESALDESAEPENKISMASLEELSKKGSSVLEAAQSKTRKWDQQVKEMEKEEEDEGDVDGLFRRIYSTSSEEVRRAMNKSFQESKGTVLSTNWDQVKKEKVEMKPSESVEFKKW